MDLIVATAMTSLEELAATVALLRHGDRPWAHYAPLLEDAGSALALLRGEYDADDEDGAPAQLSGLSEEPDLEAITDEIAAWQGEGIALLSVLDEAYPANLREIHNRPPLLFARGELQEADACSVAVVGTRQPSERGLALARELSAGLAECGQTIVSGLAQGIDTEAHLAALASGRRTIAVVGTGLRRAYPAANAGLQARLSEESAVVSQFWPDQPPTKRTFPLRNVVMSGIARATIVVEAGQTSGARMQARFALEHGRPVFLLASLLDHAWARDYAERPNTFVVDSANEIRDQLDRVEASDSLSLA